jgi:hypothetical protein
VTYLRTSIASNFRVGRPKNCDSKHVTDKKFIPSRNWGPLRFYSIGNEGSFSVGKGGGAVRENNQWSCLVPSLRKSQDIPSITNTTFMSCTGTTLP